MQHGWQKKDFSMKWPGGRLLEKASIVHRIYELCDTSTLILNRNLTPNEIKII